MKIQPNSKLVMIGDSITDCNRAHPVGEGSDGGLGNGYVSLINTFFEAVCPEQRIRILNTGVNGNTVRELKARWQSDVLDLRPDWLSVKIGINDVWRNFKREYKSQHVHLDEYVETLEELLQSAQPGLKGLILMTPYFIEADRSDPMRAMMDSYGAAVKELARQFEAVLVDTQAAFDAVLKTLPSKALAEDRVHPGLTGHMILARAFLKAIDFSW